MHVFVTFGQNQKRRVKGIELHPDQVVVLSLNSIEDAPEVVQRLFKNQYSMVYSPAEWLPHYTELYPRGYVHFESGASAETVEQVNDLVQAFDSQFT